MSGMSMHRFHIALAIAATGLAGAFQGQLGQQMVRGAEILRFGAGAGLLADRTTSPAPSRTSSLVKLRDLNFLRGRVGPRHHHYKGVPMSVAEGKRRAYKRRNRARHKAHVTKARRRA